MPSIAVSAPGKLVITGEYAVIDGASAIALAVNRRSRVSVSPTIGQSVLEVTTSGAERFPFTWQADGSLKFTDNDPAERGELLRVLLKQLVGRLPAALPDVVISIDSSEFYLAADGQKLGLGSSAAVCVSLTAALHALFGLTDDLQQLCYDVHREFQDGKGSGIDVATSLHGGVIRFQLDAMGPPKCEALSWPQGLYMLPVWTGHAASTGHMLQRLDGLRESSPAMYLNLIGELTQIAGCFQAVWQRQNVPELLELLVTYGFGLNRLDEAAAVGIYSAEHVDFQHRAAAIGAVYKPSGAGGGDFGLVFSDSSAKIEQFAADLDSAVMLPDWSPTVPGVELRTD